MEREVRFWEYMADKLDSVERRLQPAFDRIVEGACRHLRPDDRVLDYGCGTGSVTLRIAPHVRTVRAVDISGRAIEIARRKAETAGIGNVEFSRAADVDSLAGAGPFDVVLSTGVLHFFRDPRDAVERLSRLLRPGGLFLSATPCLAERMTLQTRLEFYPFLLLSKTRLFPYLKRFTFAEVDALFTGELEIQERMPVFHRLSGYFVAARKDGRRGAGI